MDYLLVLEKKKPHYIAIKSDKAQLRAVKARKGYYCTFAVNL